MLITKYMTRKPFKFTTNLFDSSFVLKYLLYYKVHYTLQRIILYSSRRTIFTGTIRDRDTSKRQFPTIESLLITISRFKVLAKQKKRINSLAKWSISAITIFCSKQIRCHHVLLMSISKIRYIKNYYTYIAEN